ncbi:hypothetical protein ACFLZO_01350 [Patescibacteria group bacterium]
MKFLISTAKVVAAVGVVVAVAPLVTSLILVSAYYNRREQRYSHLYTSL